MSWAIDVGGALPLSAMNAVHASFFDVARMRAEPLDMGPLPRFELIEIPTAPDVPNVTVAPGATLSEVATASFFAKEGIAVEQSAAPKSELYLSLLPLVTGKRVELLDHPKLVTQLVSLERRVTRGGRDSVDHPPGAHDDCANSAAGALTLASVPCAGFVVARGLARERQRFNISGEMTYERELWEQEREEDRKWWRV